MVWNVHRPQGPPLWGHPGVGALLRSGPCLGCLGSFMLCTEGHRASESQEARWRVWATHVPVHTHLPRAHPRLPCTPTCAEAEPELQPGFPRKPSGGQNHTGRYWRGL